MKPGGTIDIAGKTVSRLGLGTLRLAGPGGWGGPEDRAQAVGLLREAVHQHGITHIDTADSYGPHTVEDLLKEALHPYPDELLIATKVGLVRPAPDVWTPFGHPAYLRASVEGSLRRRGVERLELCYLHRIDWGVPVEDQIGTLEALREEGKVGHIGMSKITADDFHRWHGEIGLAAVQNVLNIHDRHDPVQGSAATTVSHTFPTDRSPPGAPPTRGTSTPRSPGCSASDRTSLPSPERATRATSRTSCVRSCSAGGSEGGLRREVIHVLGA